MLVRLRNEAGPGAMDMAVEVPLRCWREVGGSKLTLWSKVVVPFELLKIRKHYNPTREPRELR
jgi:hypothetical protein